VTSVGEKEEKVNTIQPLLVFFSPSYSSSRFHKRERRIFFYKFLQIHSVAAKYNDINYGRNMEFCSINNLQNDSFTSFPLSTTQPFQMVEIRNFWIWNIRSESR